MNSVTSIPEGLNAKRSDPRISQETFTLKVKTSKPQQPGAFVIEHQTEKSAVLQKKVVIPFPSFLGLELVERKITLDTSEPPRMFYKRKNESRVNSTWSEHFEIFNPAGSSLSSTTNKSRVQIQLQQPNESFSTLIHSDGNLKRVAEAGIRETYTHSSQEMLEPEAFSPVTKDATLVRASTARRLRTTKTSRCNVADKNVQRDPAAVQEIKECLVFQLALSTKKNKTE